MATLKKVLFAHRILTDEEITKNREQVEKLFEVMHNDTELQERYHKLTTDWYNKALSDIESLGFDRSSAFEELWADQYGEKCPLPPEMQACAAVVTLNILSVAHALLSLKDEVAGRTLSTEAVDKMFRMFGELGIETMVLGPPDKKERGN